MPLSLSALVDRAEALLARPGRVVLDITGAPGAGKSTLAELLLARLGESLGHDAVAHLRRHEQFGKSPDEARRWVERVDEPNAGLVLATRSSADLAVPLAAVTG